MSVTLKVAFGSFVAIATLGGLLFYLFRSTPDEVPASEERLTERLQRRSVHFHLVLRERLTAGGPPFAARLQRAASERDEARGLARQLLQALDSGPADETNDPVLAHFGGPRLSPAMDRFHVVLAMLWSERHPAKDRRLPGYALLHEARALDPSELDAAHAGLTMAVRAYAHAAGGYCDMVEPLIEPANGRVSPSQMTAWLPDDADTAEARAEAAATLERLQRLLIDGSLACCAMRNERLEETARRLEQSISDAERLGVCERRLPLLRAWAALLRGRHDEARRELESLDPSRLHEDDREPHRIIRSALAAGGEDGASRALVGTTRSEWLSRLVIAGALEAVEGSALAAALRTGDAPRAAQRFIEAEAAVIDAARSIDPFFEQGRMSRE